MGIVPAGVDKESVPPFARGKPQEQAQLPDSERALRQFRRKRDSVTYPVNDQRAVGVPADRPQGAPVPEQEAAANPGRARDEHAHAERDARRQRQRHSAKDRGRHRHQPCRGQCGGPS